jgi:hypothetical protein
MKRGGPLRRNTPLKATQGLKRGGRLNPVSKKRQKLLAKRRQVIDEILKTRTMCEASTRIWNVDRAHRCFRIPWDVHEPLTRARGGSITDPANMMVVCRPCHDWIHTHPQLATQVGLLVSGYTARYDQPDGEDLDD